MFLLTAVAGMIGAVAGRLARIIDRARLVEGWARDTQEPGGLARHLAELRELRLRGRLANGCIALLTSCGLFIGLTIILLFLGETTSFRSNWSAVISFLLGVGCFSLALLAFLVETVIAARLLNFPVLRRLG